jgi:hypothetical protein
MTDSNMIRVIPFCGKVDEWPIWCETILSKAKRLGFKDLLLGRLAILSLDEEFDSLSEIGKEKSRIIKLNEIAYSELILLIDVKTSSGKTAFNIDRTCKTKDHPDGNAAAAWEKLKNKYEPVSDPTLVKFGETIQRNLLEERSRSRDLDYGLRRPSCQA